MKFAVIGGDMRQAKLAEMLTGDGHRVYTALMNPPEREKPGDGENWRAALEKAEYIVLPLPASSGGGVLNTPMWDGTVKLSEILEAIRQDQTVLAGRLDGEMRHLAETKGIRLIDYFEREEMTVTNAAVTAEGAIQLLMEELPHTILWSNILVIGYGRIGKLLSMRLRALGANVTVSARKFADFAWIEAMGLACADTRKLDGIIGEYDAVVNTVPCRVLTRELLSRLKEGCLCLDLASRPGGIDFEVASELGVRAIWALSLPGKVAPVTSGLAVKKAIYNIISELECTD